MFERKKMSSISLILGIILWIIILPFLLFWLGVFDGWLAKLLIGDALTKGLNMIFNTTYFTKDMLPIMGGVLAWIGSFFHNISSVNSNKKN